MYFVNIDERLPHKYPVRFIKEVKEENETDAESLIEFMEMPTLAGVVEAAAQNVVFIKSMYRQYDGGVLTGMKDVILLEELQAGEYHVKSAIAARIEHFCTIKFELLSKSKIVAQGQMNIVMKERK